MSINPLYSLFSHSCVPNVVCSNPDNGSTVTMKAIIDFRKGHELLISYLDDDLLDLPLAERQKLLFNWFGGRECRCSRCQVEAIFGQNITERG